MNYSNFLEEIESEIERSLKIDDQLSSIELVIVINHLNDLTSRDLSIVDFLDDSSLQFIYNMYFLSKK